MIGECTRVSCSSSTSGDQRERARARLLERGPARAPRGSALRLDGLRSRSRPSGNRHCTTPAGLRVMFHLVALSGGACATRGAAACAAREMPHAAFPPTGHVRWPVSACGDGDPRPCLLPAAAAGAASLSDHVQTPPSQQARGDVTARLAEIAAIASDLDALVASSTHARGAQHRQAQRDPLGRRLGESCTGRHSACASASSVGAPGNSGGVMAVGTDAEHDHVECGHGAGIDRPRPHLPLGLRGHAPCNSRA